MASQIRYLVLMLLVLIALAATACSDSEPSQDIGATVTSVRVATAQPAPIAADFELADSSGSTVSLSKTLSDSHFAVLVFYRGHF